MDQLLDYRERSLAILKDAQVFRIDIDAYWRISELVIAMKRDGLDELFSQLQLPFPTMIIMPSLVGLIGSCDRMTARSWVSSRRSRKRSTPNVSPLARTPSALAPAA